MDQLIANPISGKLVSISCHLISIFIDLVALLVDIFSVVTQVRYGKGPTAKSKIMVFGCCDFV